MIEVFTADDLAFPAVDRWYICDSDGTLSLGPKVLS